jgi:hypothetical protein
VNRKRPEALKASGRLSRDLCGGVSACFLDKLLPAFPAAEVVRLIIHTQYICLALFYHFAAVIILNQLIQQFIFQLSFLLLQCQIYVSRLGLDFFHPLGYYNAVNYGNHCSEQQYDHCDSEQGIKHVHGPLSFLFLHI